MKKIYCSECGRELELVDVLKPRNEFSQASTNRSFFETFLKNTKDYTISKEFIYNILKNYSEGCIFLEHLTAKKYNMSLEDLRKLVSHGMYLYKHKD